MSYFLAVDVGTTRTAASTARMAPDGSLVTAAFGLGRGSDSAPSAVFAAEGELLFGEAAERRGLAQPDRLVREFKRRVGDDVPILAGDQRFAPEDLYASMVAWVVAAVVEREGARPTGISVAIPVTWGGYRAGLVRAALAQHIPGDVQLISEPEAAARHYESTSPLEPGRALAVYDLGGGTFDAVILRTDLDGAVRIVGEPRGLGDFGGADFDDIVLRHTISAAGLAAAELNADPDNRVALGTLRRECIEAKEALSFDAEAVVPLLVGGSHNTVRLTRSEFEEMIEPGVERTIDVLSDALDAADVSASDLDAILLTGGSSRIPRIAELLSERFDRPIAIDADPKAIVAMGAARALATAHAEAVKAQLALLPAPPADAVAVPLDPPASAQAFPQGTAADRAQRRWFQRVPATAAMAAGALVLAGGIVLVSATGLGSSPVTNARAEDDTKSLASWLGVALLDSSPAVTDEAVVAAPPAPPAPPESIQRTDYGASESSSRNTNPRSQSVQKAAEAPRSTTPTASTASGGGTGSSPGGTTPATGTTDQNPTGTTPTSDPSPSPSATEAPAPTETEAPAPTETEAPAPTETSTPTPTETSEPTPETVTETPAPEPTSSEEPVQTPEPTPSPTEPV
ncbi:Hsp70 family protein [uncultured Microbacterium sp.]|uniref:Hsp70 family protein n=1 Tax=uncultured Microbacterium sp. TaxID=191216 RepID=UPI0028D8D74F|nr:Hsp70 family protein [uncultured Microbacterium sp.]